MTNLQGIGTCGGVGDGPMFLYQPPAPETVATEEGRCSAELERLDRALVRAKRRMTSERPANGSTVPDMRAVMLENHDFLDCVRDAIRQDKLTAASAVQTAGAAFAAQMEGVDTAAVRARGMDLREALPLLLEELTYTADPLHDVTGRVVIAVDTLTPQVAMQLDRSKIAAFVVRNGTLNSPDTILIRSLDIPTVMALGDSFSQLEDGLRTMVDGTSGTVIQDPDTNIITQLAQKRLADLRNDRRAQTVRGQRCVTRHGVPVRLSANIALEKEARKALLCDAQGIGLYRTELLFSGAVPPEEDAQCSAYQDVLLAMGGRRVVIRTLDFGAQRSVFFPGELAREDSALGIHAIPYELQQRDVLMTQLRALLRASAVGNLCILLPMVVSPEDIAGVRAMMDEARAQLKAEGRRMAEHIPLGVMIETPAAALTTDILAQNADFVSIGTNDLAQYVLAASRLDHAADSRYNPKHPAVLRLVAQIARSAHAMGVPVNLCGEIAGDTTLAGFFVGIGIDELSMSSSEILPMKQAICQLTGEDCRNALKTTMELAAPPHFPAAQDTPPAEALEERPMDAAQPAPDSAAEQPKPPKESAPKPAEEPPTAVGAPVRGGRAIAGMPQLDGVPVRTDLPPVAVTEEIPPLTEDIPPLDEEEPQEAKAEPATDGAVPAMASGPSVADVAEAVARDLLADFFPTVEGANLTAAEPPKPAPESELVPAPEPEPPAPAEPVTVTLPPLVSPEPEAEQQQAQPPEDVPETFTPLSFDDADDFTPIGFDDSGIPSIDDDFDDDGPLFEDDP